jgi:restriction endonuclease S subunit
MNYKEIEKKFNENKNKMGNEFDINFKDVYPIDTNNGACLFTQHCIYMLEENGSCAIVLPDGELFTGNKFKKFREYMCEKVNIIKIINVGGKAFEHTAIKTAVIIFQKNGCTKNIEFMDIPDDCNSVKRLMIVPVNNIKNNNYSLSYNAYITKKDTEYSEGVVVKTLGELFNLNGNGKTNSKDITNTGEYPFYKASCNNPSGTHNTFDFDGKEYLLIIKSGGSSSKPISENYGIGKVFVVNGKCAANIAVFQLLPKTINNFKYLYYCLKSIQNKIQGLAKYSTNNGNIDMKELMEIKIPIPSLDRQQEIVEECEQITKSIDTIKLRKEQLKCDGILFKKYYKHNELNEIYKNSVVKTLGEVCDINNIKKYETSFGKEFGKYKFYTGGANKIYYNDEYNIDVNTIILNKTNGSGKCNIFIDKNISCAIQTHTIQSKSNENETKYIYYYLSSNMCILEKGYIGPCHKNLQKTYLEQLKIPIPSLENQEKVVAYYEQMTDEYKKHILDKIDDYNKELEMFKELCVNMFSL